MEDFPVRLHDGTTLVAHSLGAGPAVLLPVRLEPYDEQTAESMRQWGADPDLGPTLAEGLARRHRVIAADYEGHRMAHPAPDTLTPDNVSGDLLAIADAARAERFAYYGYSWLALSGLQLALRTDRLWALVMGGYPPLGGPYATMLAITRTAQRLAAEQLPEAPTSASPTPGDWDSVQVTADLAQTKQFVTLYESLQSFDDAEVQGLLDMPRLVFTGGEDDIEYGADWGGVVLEIAEPVVRRREELARHGWDVEVLPGLDHMSAMHSTVVLPLLERWLAGAAPA